MTWFVSVIKDVLKLNVRKQNKTTELFYFQSDLQVVKRRWQTDTLFLPAGSSSCFHSTELLIDISTTDQMVVDVGQRSSLRLQRLLLWRHFTKNICLFFHIWDEANYVNRKSIDNYIEQSVIYISGIRFHSCEMGQRSHVCVYCTPNTVRILRYYYYVINNEDIIKNKISLLINLTCIWAKTFLFPKPQHGDSSNSSQ